MPRVTVDYHNPEPIYRQLAAILREAIRSGDLAPRTPIPSEKSLQQQHGVARETVRAAVRLLRDEGWVYTLPQRGTYVSPHE